MLFSFGSEQKNETGNGTQCQSKKSHKDNIDVRQKIRLAFSCRTKKTLCCKGRYIILQYRCDTYIRININTHAIIIRIHHVYITWFYKRFY